MISSYYDVSSFIKFIFEQFFNYISLLLIYL